MLILPDSDKNKSNDYTLRQYLRHYLYHSGSMLDVLLLLTILS